MRSSSGSSREPTTERSTGSGAPVPEQVAWPYHHRKIRRAVRPIQTAAGVHEATNPLASATPTDCEGGAMVTAPFLRSWIVACIAAALVACQDQPLPMTAPLAPVAEIFDAVHPVGNPHFFFLPPLVPMPTFGGTSDETQKPVVKVCQWLDATCVARIAEFPMESGTAAQVIRYDAKNQLYIVNWPTGQCVSGPCTLTPRRPIASGSSSGSPSSATPTSRLSRPARG